MLNENFFQWSTRPNIETVAFSPKNILALDDQLEQKVTLKAIFYMIGIDD